jgi:hypothetical protein
MPLATINEMERTFLVAQLGALAVATDTLQDLRAKFYSGINAGTLSLDKTARPLFSGRYYTYDDLISADTTVAGTLGLLSLFPFTVPTVTTFDRIGVEVTAGIAGSTVECCVYSFDGVNFNKVIQSSIAGDTPGFLVNTINLTLQPGLYWLGQVTLSPTTAPTCRARSVAARLGMTTGNDNTSAVGPGAIASAGAVPASFGVTTSQIGTVPKVMIRKA